MTTGTTGQLGLALPVQGELSGTWGDTVNNGITQYTNLAIAATLTLTGDGAVTLTNTTGDSSATNITSSLAGAGTVTAQHAVVRISGTTTTKVITFGSAVLAPYSKTYVVDNASSYSVTFKAYGQTGVSIVAGEKCTVYYNGTDIVKVATSATTTGTVTSVGGTGTVNGISLSGTVTSTGNLTLGGTLSGVSLTSQVTGTLPIANGGTGTTSTTFVNAATNVTGTLPVGNGGTGASSLTANNVLLGNGTSAVQAVAPSTSGNVLTSNGTTWQSSAPTGITAGKSITFALVFGS